jgi:hypothetical protein
LQLRMGLLPLTYPHLGSKNSRIILLTKIFIPVDARIRQGTRDMGSRRTIR